MMGEIQDVSYFFKKSSNLVKITAFCGKIRKIIHHRRVIERSYQGMEKKSKTFKLFIFFSLSVSHQFKAKTTQIFEKKGGRQANSKKIENRQTEKFCQTYFFNLIWGAIEKKLRHFEGIR